MIHPNLYKFDTQEDAESWVYLHCSHLFLYGVDVMVVANGLYFSVLFKRG